MILAPVIEDKYITIKKMYSILKDILAMFYLVYAIISL